MRTVTLCALALTLASCSNVIPGGSQPAAAGTGGATATATATGTTSGSPASTSAAAPQLGADNRYVCDAGPYGGVAEARRLTPDEYRNVVTDALGLDGSEDYPGAYGESVTGFSTEPTINVIGEQGVEQILYAAEQVAESLSSQLDSLLPCVADGDRACAETFLQTVGRRLFRRSLTDTESSQLLDVFDEETADGATFEEGVSLMTAQLLQMPAFLYVVEAPADAGVSRQLTGPELASRLSFHFWNSAPDDELLDLAESGALADATVLEQQAQRLFDDPRSDRGFVRFVREWTGTYKLTTADKDADAFSYLSDAFVDSVNESFDHFAVKQFRESGDLRSLLGSSQVFVDQNLASFFGVDAPASGFAEVTLDPTRYSGVTTQPAMLAALSHSSETSYVFRGKFIRERLLCQSVGTPPGNAMSEFAQIEKPEDPTARDLSELVRGRAACGGCHNLLDPPGLAYENFDAMGDYRESYDSGKAIDTTGTLDGFEIQFTSPTDLMAQLMDLPEVRDCVARQIFRYTASRWESSADACAIQQISDTLEATDGQLASAFIEATNTESFKYRLGE